MSESPSKYAEIVDGLTNTKSPRKKAALCRKGLFPSSEREQLAQSADLQVDLISEFQRLKRARNAKSSVQRAAIGRLVAKTSRQIAKKKCSKYGISWKYLVRCKNADKHEVEPPRKENRNKISTGQRKDVEDEIYLGIIHYSRVCLRGLANPQR